jgi:DNA-binding MarR family transcriptional regulator
LKERILTKVDTRPREKKKINLQSHIPALFVTLGVKIGRHADRHHARLLGFDLREWRVIQVVGADGRCTILDVAEIIGMNKGGISRSIARLEERGLLARFDDPKDRRRSFVELTTSGKAIHEEIAQFALAREERLLRDFSDEERALLINMLNRVHAEAGEMLVEGWSPGNE